MQDVLDWSQVPEPQTLGETSERVVIRRKEI